MYASVTIKTFVESVSLFNVNLIRCKKKASLESSQLTPHFWLKLFPNGSGRFTKMVTKKSEINYQKTTSKFQLFL